MKIIIPNINVYNILFGPKLNLSLNKHVKELSSQIIPQAGRLLLIWKKTAETCSLFLDKTCSGTRPYKDKKKTNQYWDLNYLQECFWCTH